MTTAAPPSELSTAQLVALAHVTRQRLWAELAHGPVTISELARRLEVNKGNVAHHLMVLERVGLIRRGRRRTVRGGTEQKFERAVHHVRTSQPGKTAREVTASSVAVIGRELAHDPAAHLHLRHLRLTTRQADEVMRHLDAVLESLTPANPPERERGIVVGMWTRSAK